MVPGQEEVRIGFLSRIRSFPLAGLVLLGLLASGFTASWPALPRLVAAMLCLVWIPGAVILRDVFRARFESGFVQLPLQFFTGLSFASIVIWAVVIAGAGLGACAAALEWITGLVLALGWYRGARQTSPRARAGTARWWRHAAVLAVLAVFVSVRPPVPDVEQDAYDHIGYVRQIVSTGELVPPGVLAPPVGEDGASPPDPRKGTLHDLLAVVSMESGMDAVETWVLLPVVLFPLAFYAFIGFCRAFVKRAWALVACAALFAASYGGLGYEYAPTAAYGQNLAVVWYWLLVPVACSRRHAWLVVLLAVGGVFVHYGVALHASILAATLLLFRPFAARPWRIAGALLAGALGAALWKHSLVRGDTNIIHAHPQGLLSVTTNWVVISPLEILREHGMLFLGGLAAVLVLLAFVRRGEEVRSELSFAALPLLLCFVPPVTTVLVDKASYMVSRSLLNVPVFAMAVSAAAYTIRWSRSGGLAARAVGVVVLLAWSLAFIEPTVNSLARPAASPSQVAPPRVDPELLRYLRRLPEGAVILSDPKTSYELSALTNHRFAAILGQHANPFDPLALDRLEAVRDVLSPYVVSSRTVEACRRYGVDFVVVNGDQRASADEFLSLWDSRNYGPAVDKLVAIAGKFRDVYRGRNFVVFLHDPGGVGETVWGPAATPLRFGTDATVTPCRVQTPEAAFEISAVGFSPDEVVPGETVAFTIGYAARDRTPFGFPYSVYVRLDHADVDGTPDFPGSKYVRRFRERMAGERLRWTLRHRPFGGLIEADMFPIGASFYESFVVKIPSNMKPGQYALKLTIERDGVLPNFAVADLMVNRDRLEGTRCAVLTVTRQRTRVQ